MKEATLDARLSAVAGYVRQDAVFADIGTDHAYLPIYLLQKGVVSSAIAADIAKGPLETAKKNAKLFSLQDKIQFFLTDGLAGLSNLGITDIAVCGMGGELISAIIEKAPFVKSSAVRLILQPMSKQEVLRKYLYENGFSILEERIGAAAGHIYSCICAEYDGKNRKSDLLLLHIGSPVIENEEDAKSFASLLEQKELALTKRINGLKTAGEEANEEKELLSAIAEKRRRLYENWGII